MRGGLKPIVCFASSAVDDPLGPQEVRSISNRWEFWVRRALLVNHYAFRTYMRDRVNQHVARAHVEHLLAKDDWVSVENLRYGDMVRSESEF